MKKQTDKKQDNFKSAGEIKYEMYNKLHNDNYDILHLIDEIYKLETKLLVLEVKIDSFLDVLKKHPRKMTKEAIEKELGYKIDIVE